MLEQNVGGAMAFVRYLIEENKNEVMELNFFRNSGIRGAEGLEGLT